MTNVSPWFYGQNQKKKTDARARNKNKDEFLQLSFLDDLRPDFLVSLLQ